MECATEYTRQRAAARAQQDSVDATLVSRLDKRIEAKKRADARAQRRETKAALEQIKTRREHLSDAQKVFNRWVRLRDRAAGWPCIGCGNPVGEHGDASHYRSVGACGALRFEHDNVWLSCVPCNQHKGGNVVEYRINLVARIGVERVAWLEGPHAPITWSIEQALAIKVKYRALARELLLS